MRRLLLPAGLVLSSLLGCAMAHNYRDPTGPRFDGAYAPRADSGRADSSLTQARPGATGRIRVVTYNIKVGLRVDSAIVALRTYAPLRAPDLFLAQELDSAAVETLARALQLNYVYYPASLYPGTGRDLGNAVLTPWPIEAARKLPLPHASRVIGQGRAAVAARVRIAGRPVRVYSVHLGSPIGIGPEDREAQARVVLADALRSPDPVVIGGDFNSRGVGWIFVEGGFTWATGEVGRTMGPFSFDHVFARGFNPSAARRAGVVREADQASDHFPVWAEFTFALSPGAN